MDLIEKAAIRIEHWIAHNDEHVSEYRSFAEELKSAGKADSAQQILKAAEQMAQGSDAMRRALKALS
jgi:NAD-specific glutamate dehydrogenase